MDMVAGFAQALKARVAGFVSHKLNLLYKSEP
jgi:hypothetical protein